MIARCDGSRSAQMGRVVRAMTNVRKAKLGGAQLAPRLLLTCGYLLFVAIIGVTAFQLAARSQVSWFDLPMVMGYDAMGTATMVLVVASAFVLLISGFVLSLASPRPVSVLLFLGTFVIGVGLLFGIRPDCGALYAVGRVVVALMWFLAIVSPVEVVLRRLDKEHWVVVAGGVVITLAYWSFVIIVLGSD